MDTLYAFLLFAGLLVLENLASMRWLPGYFRTGIPVYIKYVPAAPIEDSAAAARLEAAFKSGEQAAIRFRNIGPGQVALREDPFAPRTGPRYLPVMHSLIYLDLRDGRAAVRGSVNWYVLAALGYAAYRSLQDSSFIPVNLLLVIIFALSYLAQASILSKVGKTLSENLGS